MAQRTGALVFDERTDRYDIRFDLNTYYGGLHCGECFDVFVRGNKSHEEALPKVTTPHTLRHTFCTNLANAGMNPKALQYIMGHSNINMTLNYYAHATSDSAMAEMERLIA